MFSLYRYRGHAKYEIGLVLMMGSVIAAFDRQLEDIREVKDQFSSASGLAGELIAVVELIIRFVEAIGTLRWRLQEGSARYLERNSGIPD